MAEQERICMRNRLAADVLMLPDRGLLKDGHGEAGTTITHRLCILLRDRLGVLVLGCIVCVGMIGSKECKG